MALDPRNKINQSAEEIKKSQQFYRESIDDLLKRGKRSPESPFISKSYPIIGSMYLFAYDPKLKNVLPFWDTYPLTFVIEHYGDGFLGLNLHYLPPAARKQLLDALTSLSNNDKYDETTRLKISYRMLKAYSGQFSGYTECVKKYLYGHVRSSYQEVNPKDWGKVVLLPLQNWQTNANSRLRARPPY
jgi:hypothetical protein